MKNSKNYQLSSDINVLQLQKKLYDNRLISLSVELEICNSYRLKLNDNSKGLLYLLNCINSLEETISNLTDVLKEVEEQLISVEKEINEQSNEIKGELENV